MYACDRIREQSGLAIYSTVLPAQYVGYSDTYATLRMLCYVRYSTYATLHMLYWRYKE